MWYVQIVSEKASQSTPSSFHKGGGRGRTFNFSKTDRNGAGSLKSFATKGEESQNVGEGRRVV